MVGMSITELKAQAMELSPKERADLARALLESLEVISDEEREKLWLEEVGRRIERVQTGQSTLIPFEEAMQRMKEAREKRSG
jgi:putative addiction module component (TIGR02574 family)